MELLPVWLKEGLGFQSMLQTKGVNAKSLVSSSPCCLQSCSNELGLHVHGTTCIPLEQRKVESISSDIRQGRSGRLYGISHKTVMETGEARLETLVQFFWRFLRVPVKLIGSQ